MTTQPNPLKPNTRPHALLLVPAVVLSLVLWFVPFVEFLGYPFRIFVTFIHEGGHAMAALATGNSVRSLSVASDGSGLTQTTVSGLISEVCVSSAGYLGAMAFGALLLVLIRHAVPARKVLGATAAFILVLTLVFGLITPLLYGWQLAGIPFTLGAGLILAAGLLATARYATPDAANHVLCFLAIQCVLNALLDLRTLIYKSSILAPAGATDAGNMARATHIPDVFWTVLWIAIALLILWKTLRLYLTPEHPTPNVATDAPHVPTSLP